VNYLEGETRFRLMVTGHRPGKLGGYTGRPKIQRDVRGWLRDKILEARECHPEGLVLLSGMALGVDQWFAEEGCLLEVPYLAFVPFEGQAARWPADSRAYWYVLCARAERVIYTGTPGYSPAKMHVRNEALVDSADAGLAVWDGSSGGTAGAVRYALRWGLPLEYCPFVGVQQDSGRGS
jgi:uncharacterized phage-like protein YoqJ